MMVFLAIIPVTLAAGEVDGFKISADAEFQASSRPEVKLRFNLGLIFPFLQGENPLISDNNIKFVLSAYATPVSLAGIGELIWTPVAFLMFSGGGQATTGWNMPLGQGLGINTPIGAEGTIRKSEIKGGSFDGLVWSAWGAGTFQFDLGAVIPGDWTHVVFQTRQEFRYSAYTRAKAGESWVFENDDGENRNGWRYFATYILGYQMPLSPVLNMIGIMAELDKKLYTAPGGDYWGDSLGYWIFSGMGVFTITPNFDATLAIQMRTRRNNDYIQFERNKNNYYKDVKLITEGGERRLVFYRVALMLNYRFF